ncbi:MAG TPA: right-handed parallel beta-helix repeat-containing protein [Verrucomicrobiae bacterium]|nr:right-handed parallel beta-helix repeat-containing protein [Verrucomicrobiae bacterium]
MKWVVSMPCVALCLASLVLTGHATVIYVDRDAAGAGDGTSWQDSYRDLTSALAASTNGDQIWMAEGTYKPNDAGGSLSRGQSYQLKNGVGVYGGFVGTETNLAQRDFMAHKTILSGDLGGDDRSVDGLPDQTSMTDNCYHVVFGTNAGLGPTALLSGLAVSGGYGTNGGGMYLKGCSPTISDCALSSNAADLGGGAIYAEGSSSSIQRCSFVANICTGLSLFIGCGGAIQTGGGALEVDLCVFSGNRSDSGGAIDVGSDELARVSSSTFLTNIAPDGGGAICGPDGLYASLSISNCLFVGNRGNGGAISMPSVTGDVTIVGCAFTRNFSPGSGGAIHNGGAMSVSDCTFEQNTATMIGGAIETSAIRDVRVNNCTFYTNICSGLYGGAVSAEVGNTLILNCTLVADNCTWPGPIQGRAIYALSGSTIGNCVVWPSGTNLAIVGASVVSNCIVRGGFTNSAGRVAANITTNNPSLKPIGSYGGPTRTMPPYYGSPAIDAGFSGLGVPSFDQRGFERDAQPDIGACEFQGATIASVTPDPPAAIGTGFSAQGFTDHTNVTYRWYYGSSGDTSAPVVGGTNALLVLDPADLGMDVWVEVTPSGGLPVAQSASRSLEIHGTYDEWCDFHGLVGGERLPTSCLSGDGIGNLLKYAVGLNPRQRCALGDRCDWAFQPGAGLMVQDWWLSKTPTDLAWRIEEGDDLRNWSSTGVVTNKIAEDAAFTVWRGESSISGKERGFHRLQVEKRP